jgi:hypothetical protein
VLQTVHDPFLGCWPPGDSSPVDVEQFVLLFEEIDFLVVMLPPRKTHQGIAAVVASTHAPVHS